MSSYRPLTAVVLAAGEGTRMHSARPKPLHVLVGRPMLLHVLDALSELPVERAVVVVGHGAERGIEEVNTSTDCCRRSLLAPALRRLSPENVAGEYCLSDVVAVLHDAGYKVVSMVADDPMETAGVNDRGQLAAAEALLRRRI